ncbi:hypothetical protein SANTM175S_00258 [Streptomyces antimycoticus]
MRTGGRCVQCPEFRELLTYAQPGDTVHISETFRLVRATGHILDVLDVLHRDQVAPRIHDGAFSAVDLTAHHPRTGELLPTVKFMAQTLATAGELQRDLQRELTYGGLRAAEAKGSEGGRRPAVPADKTDDVRAAYVRLRSCRSPSTCRARSPTSSAPPSWGPPNEPCSTRACPVRRGQGHALRVSTTPAVHRQLLGLCQPLGGPRGPRRSRHGARPPRIREPRQRPRSPAWPRSSVER